MKKQTLIGLMAIVIVGLFSLASAFAQPVVRLTMPKTNLAPGDSLVLDLELIAMESKKPIDLYFSLDMGFMTFYLNSNLQFISQRVPVLKNFQPVDIRARIFGTGIPFVMPSIFGEVKIPPDTNGTFTWVAEIFDSSSGISLSQSQIVFIVSPSVPIPVTTTTTTSIRPTTTTSTSTTSTSTTTTTVGPLTLENITITEPLVPDITLHPKERVQISSTITFAHGLVLSNIETGIVIKTVQGDIIPIFDLVYSSSNPEVAEVDLNGLVTAVSPGIATITVKAVVVAPPEFRGFEVSPKATDSIKVTVRRPVLTLESITITNPPIPDITLRPGEDIQIVTTMALSDGTALPNTSTGFAWRTGKGLVEEALVPIFLLVYSSSNPAAVKVNLEGLVRAVSPGTAVITVSAVVVAPPGFMGFDFEVSPKATDSINVTVQPITPSTTSTTIPTTLKEVVNPTKVWKLSYSPDLWDEKIVTTAFDWFILTRKNGSITFETINWDTIFADRRDIFSIVQEREKSIAGELGPPPPPSLSTEIVETTKLFTTKKGIQGADFINTTITGGFNRTIGFKNNRDQVVEFMAQSQILENVKSSQVEDILNTFEFLPQERIPITSTTTSTTTTTTIPPPVTDTILTPLLGTWRFTYTISTTTFTDTYYLQKIITETQGLRFVTGVDKFGDPVIANWSDLLGKYVLLDLGIIIDKWYEFDISGNTATGLYFQISPPGANFSRGYPMTGVKISSFALKSQSLSPTELQLSEQREETLRVRKDRLLNQQDMRTVLPQGIIEDYLRLRSYLLEGLF